jgi:transcription elongation factor SPT4
MEDIDDDAPVPVVPAGDRKLRACLVTGLIKTEDQWLRDGNENLPCLEMMNDREMVQACTSPNFDGMVAVMTPNASWTARWQGLTNYVPGCYALRVKGSLPSQHRVTLEDNGIRYRPLDEEAVV